MLRKVSQYSKDPSYYKRKAKEWAKKNPIKAAQIKRKGLLKAKYGLSWEDFVALYTEQEGRCKICSIFMPFDNATKAVKPHVDHCHKTGKVRGLLCNHCNVALAMLKDDPILFEKAKQYLYESLEQ